MAHTVRPSLLRRQSACGRASLTGARPATTRGSGRWARLDIGQGEVVLPLLPVRGALPGPRDPVAVVGDHPGVALPEAGRLAPELPDPAVQGHLVDARDAA